MIKRFRYWRKCPPASVMLRGIAQWAGVWEPKKDFKPSTKAELQGLARLLGGRG